MTYSCNLIEFQTYRAQVTFRQEYVDSRLAFSTDDPEDYITLTGEEAKSVWRPDTFIRNERSTTFHDAMEPNEYARIYPDGRVLTSQRVTFALSCPGLPGTLGNDRSMAPKECYLDIASCKLTSFGKFKVR